MSSWFSWFSSTSKAPAAPPPPPPPPAVTPPPPPPPPPEDRSLFSPRSVRQLGLFFAGAGFLAWSTMVTRRSVVRKQLADIPKFYQPSGQLRASAAAAAGSAKPKNPEGSLIAVEALGLATLNVMAFGIMMTGGLSWAFDVSSIEDLRRMARKHIGPAGGKTDEESEKEVEEWVAKILSRTKKDKGDAGDSQDKQGR